jgi:hypothetical protein
MKRGIRGALCVFIGIQLLGTASGEDSQLEERLRTCAGLPNSTERLLCYDRIVANIGNNDAPATPLSPEILFGVSGQMTRETAPAKEAEREAIQSIAAQVTALRVTAGVLVIELDNGQTWQQMDTTALLLKIGDAITISRGALSSFRLSTISKRVARVKRVQ